jgi:hypothetical protein
MSGKGDGYRPVDREKFSSNWDRIFSKTEDRETSSRKTEKAPDRCPNTIDIEEQLNAEK